MCQCEIRGVHLSRCEGSPKVVSRRAGENLGSICISALPDSYRRIEGSRSPALGLCVYPNK